ncbi:MAG: hypothetical protein Q4C56_05515 [Peptococcaceae bacterium]|nr:hypothetical protein [Peptococcaceae bacterium]
MSPLIMLAFLLVAGCIIIPIIIFINIVEKIKQQTVLLVELEKRISHLENLELKPLNTKMDAILEKIK